MTTPPKKVDQKTTREQRSMLHGVAVRSNYHVLSEPSFRVRRDYLTNAYETGAFLKNPDQRGQAPPNPMTDPNAMDGMMGMMKNNMAMMIPNTLIMSWINAFFSGFVIIKLPFPITIKFKSMLQAGVATREMDPRWMSSISWYFLCYFGLQSVFNFLLGSDNGEFPSRSYVYCCQSCLHLTFSNSRKSNGPADVRDGTSGPSDVRTWCRSRQAI